MSFIFGAKSTHRYFRFRSDGDPAWPKPFLYSSPTHADLPRLPVGQVELTSADIRCTNMYLPQIYSPTVEHLPFLLTHFSEHDSLLGSLTWNTHGEYGGYPVIQVDRDGRSGYILHESKRTAWRTLEDILRGGADVIWHALGDHFSPALLFGGHLRQASSTGYLKVHDSHKRAVASITAARDALLLSAALLSYAIAWYRRYHPSTPDGWHALLTSYQLHPTTADRIRSSDVAHFGPHVRRVGAFVNAEKAGQFSVVASVYASSHIPLWFVWPSVPKNEAHLRVDIPDYLRPYIPGEAEERSAVDVSPTRMETTMKPIKKILDRIPLLIQPPFAPNSFIPPPSLIEALVNAEADWESFIAEKKRLYKTWWRQLGRNTLKQIQIRVNDFPLINHPSQLKASVWVWEGIPSATKRRQVIDATEINTVWEDPQYHGRRLYDPLRNEIDLCTEFPASLKIIDYQENDTTFFSDDDDETFMASHIHGFDRSDDGSGTSSEVTLPAMGTLTHLGRVRCMNTIEMERISLPKWYAHPLIGEFIVHMFGISLIPDNDQVDVAIITSEDWQKVQWVWACPDLQANDLGQAYVAPLAQATTILDSETSTDAQWRSVFHSLPPRTALYLELQIWHHPTSSSTWFIIYSSSADRSEPILVVYDAATAHYCLSLAGTKRSSELKDILILRGTKFSIRVRIWNAYDPLVPDEHGTIPLENLQRHFHARMHQLRTRQQQELYVKQVSLGWRDTNAVYTPEDVYAWLEAVQRWCMEFPERAHVALREGGIVWRVVICFVDASAGARTPRIPEIMPRDQCIPDFDHPEYLLADDYLLEEERNLICGVYDCYKDGRHSLSLNSD
jgi:hypothetical protein